MGAGEGRKNDSGAYSGDFYYERRLNRDHIHMACLRCGKNHGVRQRYFREAERAGGERLPLPDRGVAAGNWRILRGVFEVIGLFPAYRKQ